MFENNTIISGFSAIIGICIGYLIGCQKYAFEKIYDCKLICIKDLYKQIVNLEFMLKKYVHFIGADTKKEVIGEKMGSLNKVENSFQEFQHKFREEEIILDENTAEVINNFLNKYIEIISQLTVSNIQQQQGDYKPSFENWNQSFELVKTDLVNIKNELKTEFRKTLKINFLKILKNKFWL